MDGETGFCPVHAFIDVLQEKWTLHIVRNLLDGPRGFNELGRGIGGCNPATLAQRLEHLEKLGIVEKTVHSVMPPRTAYELSQSGRALQGVIGAIDQWARRFLPTPVDASGETSGPRPRAAAGRARRHPSGSRRRPSSASARA